MPALGGFVMNWAASRMAGFEGGENADAGQAAFRRAEPAGGGDHSRGNRAPPHLAPDAGRAGQTQPPSPLATAVRLEQAPGVARPKALDGPPAPVPANGDIAPDGLGAYSRRAVTWLEGGYVTGRAVLGGAAGI